MVRSGGTEMMGNGESVTNRHLCLVRHGQAAPKDVGLTDFERTLTSKGIKQCKAVAKKITNQQFDMLFSSPADRALETAHLFAERWQYPIQQIKIIPALYDAHSPFSAITVLKNLTDEYRRVAMFGHDPLFTRLAAFFAPEFTQTMAKGAAVGINLPISAWKQIKEGIGTLEFHISPSDLHTSTEADRSSYHAEYHSPNS